MPEVLGLQLVHRRNPYGAGPGRLQQPPHGTGLAVPVYEHHRAPGGSQGAQPIELAEVLPAGPRGIGRGGGRKRGGGAVRRGGEHGLMLPGSAP